MWLLTVDPFIRISVFTAKLSKRQYCWRVFEDFHCQEYIQFFDIHCGLFMRLHFSVGCYDCRRTTRIRHGFQFSVIQILFADHVHRHSGVYNKFSFLWFKGWWRRQTTFSEGEKNAVLCFSLILGYFWLASTLLHGHIDLAIPSLLETDPQIVEHWGYADEDHLGKSFQAMDSCLEC